MAEAATPRAAVGIISIGDMGLGIARLLRAQGYHVLTTTAGRSAATHQRAEAASIEVVPTDADLVSRADYILSIVPPRDAVATAQRIVSAYPAASRDDPSRAPLYFLDLNAIAPSTARSIEATLASSAPSIRFVDGGIIGGPPAQTSPDTASPSDLSSWKRPSIPVSGPHPLADAPLSGAHLADVLSVRHLAPAIGPASGLKASFAALTKGVYALAIQSYSSAAQMGVLDELLDELGTRFPTTRATADRGVVHMPPKAYRWVGEMSEIGKTFADEGGWGPEANVFENIAEVYRVVADETGLAGAGRTEIHQVVEGLVEGLQKNQKKN